MTIRRFQKRPLVIEAMQFDGTLACAARIAEWANSFDNGTDDCNFSYRELDGDPVTAYDSNVATAEGFMHVSVGDWVIRGVKGEFYPCKPDILALSYDEVV